jgi:DNA polymerase-3 subunit epsilon
MREIVLDIETTGLNYNNGDKIIEIACTELINHIASNNYLQFYCSTDRIIDDEAKKVHGLSNIFLSKFPTFAKQFQKLLDFIKDDTLVIHNASFDLGFINHELELSGMSALNNKVVDTVLLARKTLNTRVSNLDYLCRRFSIDLSSRKFHGALLDCQLLSEVYLELLGGRQTSLSLDKIPDDKIYTKNKKIIQKNKIHEIYISQEEIKKHKDFISKLKKSLWKEIQY